MDVVRILLILLLSVHAYATESVPVTFTLDGRLYDSTFANPVNDLVDFRIQVLDPTQTCIIYEELQVSVDLNATDGFFNLQVGTRGNGFGDPKRTGNTDANIEMHEVFQNSSPVNAPSCAGGVYNPTAMEGRYIRIEATPQSTGIPDVLSPDMYINSVPSALIAESLNGLTINDFVQIDTGNSLTQANMLTLVGGGDASSLHDHDSLYATLNSPASFNASITIQDNNVLRLGGYTSANSAGTLIPSFGANDPTDGGKIWYEIDTGTLHYWDHTTDTDQRILTNNSAVQSINGDSNGAQTLSTSVGAAIASPAWNSPGAGTHTLQFPLAANATTTGGGLITKAQYDVFNGKQDDLATNALTADLDLGTHKILNLVDPTNAQEGASKAYVDAEVAGAAGVFVPAAGGAFTGQIDFEGSGSANIFRVDGTSDEIIAFSANGQNAMYINKTNNLVQFDDTDGLVAFDIANNKVQFGENTASEFLVTMGNDIAGTDGFMSLGTFGAGTSLTTAGAGTRMFWYPRKASLRAGRVTTSNWNDAEIGDMSTAFGLDTRADGNNSFAVGNNSRSQGANSIALGDSALASGDGAVALSHATASGDNSLAATTGASAAGSNSVALGPSASAANADSVAIGASATTSAANAVAIGNELNSGASAAVTIGQHINASGASSVVIGSGVSNATRLTSSFTNSVVIGTNSDQASFIVKDSGGASQHGSVGIGFVDADADFASNGTELHVRDSNVSGNHEANSVLVLEKSGNMILEMKTDGSSTQTIAFGDSTDEGFGKYYDGYIRYNQADNSMVLKSADTTANTDAVFKLFSGGKFLIGDEDTAAGTLDEVFNVEGSDTGTGGVVGGTIAIRKYTADNNETTNASFGKLWVNDDDNLYFLSPTGVEIQLTDESAGSVSIGTMAYQDANSVNIDGGNIDGTIIGATTSADADFEDVQIDQTLNVDGNVSFDSGDNTFYINAANSSVGIGTAATASDVLTVSGSTIVQTGPLKIEGPGAGNSDLLIMPPSGGVAGDWRLRSKSADAKLYITGGSDEITIDSTGGGRLGIQNTSPATALDVSGVIRTNNALEFAGAATDFLLRTNSSDGTDTNSIIMSGASAAGVSRSGVVQVFGNDHGTNPGDVLIRAGNESSNGEIYMQTGGGDRLTILNNGNVGINNSSPNVALDVTGAVNASGGFQADSMTIGSATSANSELLFRNNNANSDEKVWQLRNETDGVLHFETLNDDLTDGGTTLLSLHRIDDAGAGTSNKGVAINSETLSDIDNDAAVRNPMLYVAGEVDITDNLFLDGNLSIGQSGSPASPVAIIARNLEYTSTANQYERGTGANDVAMLKFTDDALTYKVAASGSAGDVITDPASFTTMFHIDHTNAAMGIGYEGTLDSDFKLMVNGRLALTDAGAVPSIADNYWIYANHTYAGDSSIYYRNNDAGATSAASIILESDESKLEIKTYADASANTDKIRFLSSGPDDDDSFVFTTGGTDVVSINASSQVVFDGSLCVTADGTCGVAHTAGEIAAETTLNTGADYAEFFISEDDSLQSGDIVGLNQESGKVRTYQIGDLLLGVVSTKPGVVGNSHLRGQKDAVLVALVGQVPFNNEQVIFAGGNLYTEDMINIGTLLNNGNVYVNISPTAVDNSRSIASLKEENKKLKNQVENLEKRLERLEKIVNGR